MHDTIRKARELLARDYEAEFAADNEMRDARHVEMWQLPEDKTRAQAQEEPPQMKNWSEWDAWAEAHVQQGLERAADILGDEVGRVEARLVKRIKALEERVGELTAEQTVERAAAEIVDLPNWRTKHDSAA
jgi:hypothetical protein